MKVNTDAPFKVLPVETDEGTGAWIRRVFPTIYLPHLDPFMLLDEFYLNPPATIPDQPHRGFEALTYMLGGAFHHRDNLGNDSIVSAGGAQHFSAGKGIVHSELPGSPHLNHGLRLWINLPLGLKNMKPDYQQVDLYAFPERRAKNVYIRTIVGKRSPMRIHTPICYLDVTLEHGAVFQETINRNWRGLIYVLENRVHFDGVELARGEALVLEGGKLKATASNKARFVLIAGVPQNKPIKRPGFFLD